MKKISNVAASVLLCILMLAQVFSVSAASVYPTAAKIAGPASATVDDEIELIVSCEGNYILGVSGNLEYDNSALQFVSASAEIAGDWKVETNNVGNKVYFAAADSGSTSPIDDYTDIVMVTFKALKAGSTTVAIKDLVGSVNSGDIEGVVSDQYTINIADKPVEEYEYEEYYEYGDDYDYEEEFEEVDPYRAISLKVLKVKGFKLKPEFSPDVKTYEITVPYSIKELTIKAKAFDPNSTVTIKDTKLKYVGKNITRIVVTAENGSKRTYKIYTTRLPKEKGTSGSSEGFPTWLLFLLIGLAVIVIAAVVIFVILFNKKKNNEENADVKNE